MNAGDCTEYLLGVGGVYGHPQGIGEEYLRVRDPKEPAHRRLGVFGGGAHSGQGETVSQPYSSGATSRTV